MRAAVTEYTPEVAVLDMQIANMGGIAVAIDLRLEGSAGRLPDVSILLLLDREADRFLAKRADADAELVKPIDPSTLRRTIDRLVGRGDGHDRRAGNRRGLDSPLPTGCSAAWLARSVRDAEVPGSNPGIPTTTFERSARHRRVCGQLERHP